MNLLHLLEPEEFIGGLWHDMIGGQSQIAHFPSAGVRFADISRRLAIIFHGLGGSMSAEIKAAAPEVSLHRRGLRAGLGRRSERVGRARYDGDRLLLPECVDLLPTRDLNEKLYVWLVAWAATAEPLPVGPRAAVAADLARIAHAEAIEARVLAACPGLAGLHRELAAAALAVRPARRLPATEAAIEARIRARLEAIAAGSTGPAPPLPDLDEADDYRTYLPNPLWAEIDPSARRSAVDRDDEEGSGSRSSAGEGGARKGRRRQSDQIERKGALIVHRFEKILSWTEFMNIHRDVEDDEEDAARKAADDHDEIGVTKLKRKAATRLKFDLDLAPADVALEQMSSPLVYPEWDYRRQAYQPAHVRVLEHVAPSGKPDAQQAAEVNGTAGIQQAQWQPDEQAARRIRAVRRQFEALRPRREMLPRQLDGAELDMDALIRARADLAADGHGSDRIYRQAREQARDLSVAVLVDVSRSTESGVGERAVIDVEKEALVALAEGLAACGDACAVYAFSSLRRDRVFVNRVKSFDEPISPLVRDRIAALKPGFYTRLGGAVRHVSARLAERPSRKRLLLVLTDGKPNDLDHYDGRYGIEDSRRAVQQARDLGHAVFGMTVDNQAQSYFPRIFGARSYAILSRPERLTTALPVLYRHLVQ